MSIVLPQMIPVVFVPEQYFSELKLDLVRLIG